MTDISYIHLYRINNTDNIDLISDTTVLVNNISISGNKLPPVINKLYNTYYEFILINNEKKILILDEILNENHINSITDNNKNLLLEVTISETCKKIDINCFQNCSNLTKINYTNYLNNNLLFIEDNAFNNCINLIECKLFDYNNNIKKIGNNCFTNCNNLYQIQLQNSKLEFIGESAFENCNYLTEIHIPDTVNEIKNNSFTNTSLVNIYFDGKLPSNIDGNIFGNSLPNNAICYYNLNFIANLDDIKQLFSNIGNKDDIIFVEKINNTVNNYSDIYTINNINNNIDIETINKTNEILKSIIIKSSTNNKVIDIDYDNNLQESTLGYANWATNSIRINRLNNNIIVNLNNRQVNLNVAVLIHEILHILGYGDGDKWNQLSEYDIALDYYFTGKNGIYQYNKLLDKNNYKKKLKYLTREDSGGSGTSGAHLEEGFFTNEGFFNPQMRADSLGNVYPSIRYEIMSGYLDTNNYFTKISCGVLQDLGYSINYNSEWIYDDKIEFYPPINNNTSSNINSTIDENSNKNLDFGLNNTSKLRIKCNCCGDISNIIIRYYN